MNKQFQTHNSNALKGKIAMNTGIKQYRPLLKIAVSGLLLVGGAVWYAGNSKAESAAPAPVVSRPALTVRTTVLHEVKWGRVLAANGSILPWQEAIISAQVQGLRIAEVNVSIGDHVQQGDVLVTLDNFARASDATPASSRRRMPTLGRLLSRVLNCSD